MERALIQFDEPRELSSGELSRDFIDAKAGLSRYLEGLDHKFRGQGLRTICVKPGFVRTGMTEGLKAPPFAGDDLATLAHAVTSGARRPAPWGRVPGWLRRVVERGLATEPGRRWPSMPALLAALARGRVRARVRVAALVVVGIAAVVAGIAAERRWDLAARVAACDEAGAEIAAVWNDEARADLRRALVATGVPYAETAASRVVPWIDQHAAA